MYELYNALDHTLTELSVSRWGVADIRDIPPFGDEYPRALSILLAYDTPFQPHDENAFFHTLETVKSNTEQIVSEASQFLGRLDIPHFVIPQGGQAPETLKASFSHKWTAVLAGLGWIGKNCLLITPEFGPRVRLSTILIDCDLPPGTPTTESQCGACTACAAACPGGFITGLTWKPGMPRERLLDAHGCNKYRENYRPLLGRENECGRCLLTCPRGR